MQTNDAQYLIWDTLDNVFVESYNDTEDCIFFIGMVMSYRGKQFAANRFVVTEKPVKEKARVVYNTSVTYQRGLYYYSPEMHKKARAIRGELVK